MKREYPYNLLIHAYGEEFFSEPLTTDQKDGLQDFLNSLNERAQRIVTDRYKLNLPVSTIALALNTTKRTVQNIDRKIISKMQQPKNETKIKYGLKGATEIKDDTLEHLGLSIRAYNALKRGGITAITDIKSIHQLHVIRNVGRAAETEVVEKLAGRGIILK